MRGMSDPLSRFAASPFKGDDGLGCGAALAGHPLRKGRFLSVVGGLQVEEC
jgi:hypothetical protein